MMKLAVNVMFRPVETFHDLQWQGMGRVRDAVALVLLAYAVSLAAMVLTSFAHQTADTEISSLAVQAVRVLMPWAIWVVANYAVSTIAFGEGKFRDVVIGCAYALTPYIFLSIPVALLTHLVGLNTGEKYLINGLTMGIQGWCVLLFFLQIAVQHNFEGMRAFWVGCVMVFASAVITFAGVLAYALTDQVVRFVIQVFLELTIRG